MRILWYSNLNAPWVASGYGQQTALFVPRLQAMGHDVAVAAFHGLHGAPMLWNGITVYPGSSEDMWAQDIMLGHYQRHQADVLITLMDAWVLDAGKMGEMARQGVRTVHWLPVDCEPLGQLDERNLQASGNRMIAISRHGEQALLERGFDPLYVPHGVDTNIFRPLPEFRAETRERAGFSKKIIIGINAANQDPVRKGFGEQFAAFRLFHDKYPESRLLVHTRRQSRSGSDLDRLVRLLQLEDCIEFGDQYLTVTGLTSAETLNQWYNVLDVFSNCSYGEGFGIPVMEAQAAGTPVTVTDCSSLSEICGAGWKVDGDFYWNAGHAAWWTKPFIRAIADAWEQALKLIQDGGMGDMRAQAREFALQYDADLITSQFWKPVLEELGGKMLSFEEDYQSRLLKWSDIVYALPRFYDTVLRYPQAAVLELGPRGGESTTAFLAAAEKTGGHVWSVDLTGAGVPAHWRQSPVWTFIEGDDMQVELPDRKFDVMLIDSSHRYEHTLAELRRFVPLMNPGATVFMHDTLLENFDGDAEFPVARALNQFCAETGLSWTEHGGQYGLGQIDIPA